MILSRRRGLVLNGTAVPCPPVWVRPGGRIYCSWVAASMEGLMLKKVVPMAPSAWLSRVWSPSRYSCMPMADDFVDVGILEIRHEATQPFFGGIVG
jgi:hypothetical protein